MAGDSASVESHGENAERNNEVNLEGYMYKQSSRRKWNHRYFVFRSDHILSYYAAKDDSKPRGAFLISPNVGCEIGSLYVEERQSKKEILYCFKISWSECGILERQDADTHDDSVASDAGVSSSKTFPEPQSPGPSFPGPLTPPKSGSGVADKPGSLDRLGSFRSRSAGSSAEQAHGRSRSIAVTGLERQDSLPHINRRSLDGAMERGNRKAASMGTGHFSPPSLSSGAPSRRGGAGARKEQIPEDMQQNSEKDTLQVPIFIDTPDGKETEVILTPRREGVVVVGGNCQSVQEQTPEGEQQRSTEQARLHSVYLSNKKLNKKKTKKKVIEGAKFAAAAGAAIGVGAVTAGAGLVAGVLFLAASAAAGGTGIVAEAGWKRAKQGKGELVVATPDFDEATKWREALKVVLESASVRESTWGKMFMLEGRKSTSALLPVGSSGSSKSRDAASPVTAPSISSNHQKFTQGELTELLEPRARWRPMDGGWASVLGTSSLGLRVFREEKEHAEVEESGSGFFGSLISLSAEGPPCAPLKARVVLDTSPLDAFLCLMSYARIQPEDSSEPLAPNSGQRASFRVLETIDDHTDVIHLVFRPLYLFPSWTTPRDFVLYRYWRFEPDGSYVVCYESARHDDCPPHPDFVRGKMHGVYTIAPTKKKETRRSSRQKTQSECLMTSVVQVDPKGWVPITPIPVLSNQAYGEAFGVAALLQLLDMRDAIVHDRFVPISTDMQNTPPLPRSKTANHLRSRSSMDSNGGGGGNTGMPIQGSRSIDSHDDDSLNDDPVNYDYKFALRESVKGSGMARSVANYPEPLSLERWAEPDANSFRVRGATYKQDRKKINAGSSIGKLIAVDVVQVDKAIYSGFSTHPMERIQTALKREKAMKANGMESDMPSFIFVVNIILPGPPFYHGVFYYAIDDMSAIDGSDGSPSSKLCQQFFFGEDDKFRDRTFKLIPQIVQGNFMVRKAVGSTPAIMGTKLSQFYVRDLRYRRYFEVVLDCGSSSVATGVIRLSLGYAKTLVVDMGFLLEGNDDSTLPERIFGCARIKNLAFGTHLRKVHPPNTVPESTA